MWIKHALLISSLVTAACGVASAQEPPAAATRPQQTAPPLPQESANCAPVTGSATVTPEGTTVGQSNEPLGDKLAKSNGVLCPPAGVDPEMRAPTPDAGNMPVIPPPGSPGGNPNVQPK